MNDNETKRTEFIAGLRAAADFFEQFPGHGELVGELRAEIARLDEENGRLADLIARANVRVPPVDKDTR